MSGDPFKTFVCEYPFDGGMWCFEIKARGLAEAEERVKAIVWGRVSGEQMFTLPGWMPLWLVQGLCWWRNRT